MTPDRLERRREYNREWRKRNPRYHESRREYNREWQKNPRRRKYHREYQREWTKRNPNYNSEWRAKNPDYWREWQKENPDKMHTYRQKQQAKPENIARRREYWKNKDPAKEAERWRLRQYGMSQEQFEELLVKQKNCCGICRRPFSTARSAHVVVDHCHDTGRIRGLLCRKCNLALGQLGDNLESILKVVAYLKKGLMQ